METETCGDCYEQQGAEIVLCSKHSGSLNKRLVEALERTRSGVTHTTTCQCEGCRETDKLIWEARQLK